MQNYTRSSRPAERCLVSLVVQAGYFSLVVNDERVRANWLCVSINQLEIYRLQRANHNNKQVNLAV